MNKEDIRHIADIAQIDFTDEELDKFAPTFEENIELEHFQSNHEGSIVDKIQEAYQKFDGIVINPAAYTHTSIAILDALKAVSLPTVEVHISKVSEREDFRQVNFIRDNAIKSFEGLGIAGYEKAILYLKNYLEEEQWNH